MFVLLSKRRICSSISPRFFSAPSTETRNFMVADYLVSTFGFSPDEAARVSKSIAHLKSPQKPDSVRSFFEEHGFSEADVKKLITRRPSILCSSPQRSLYPNLRLLRDIGLSTSTLKQIIISNPTALILRSAVSRITFWMDFLGGNEALLVKAFTHNIGLIDRDINQAIATNISLLQTHGFSNQEVARIVSTLAWLITSRTSRVEDALKRTNELGFQPGSGMFLQGLHAMVSVNRAAVNKKMDLLKSFGWSEDDFFVAVRKAPLIVALKEEHLRAKMNFLLEEARCAPSYIVSHPTLLTRSLEKRLRPRNNVLHLLEIRGLSVKGRGFLYAIMLTNNQFVGKYIIPHKEEISGLHETYLTDCA